MDRSPVILIVDDKLLMCENLKRLLGKKEYEILTAHAGQEALSLLEKSIVDLFILDVHLPDITGLSILSHIKSHHPDTPVIYITDDMDLDAALADLRCGAFGYLRRPFEPDELVKTVENAIIQKKLKREKETLYKELNLSEEKYRYLVQNSPDLIYTLDVDGKFTFLSNAVEHLLGFKAEDLIGKHYSTIVCQADLKKATWHFNERRRGSRATSGLELLLMVNGNSLPESKKTEFVTVELKSIGMYQEPIRDGMKQYVGTHGVIRDISARKRLQAQLQNAERLDSIGTLAGGVAHDFNNLLMGIQGRSSLIAMDLDPSSPHHEHLQAIDYYIHSARELTKQLLGFARGGKYEVRPTNLNKLVAKTAHMFGRTKKEISIHTDLIEKDIAVESDQRQIEQVLLNLFVNAWHAMPNGGELYLRTTISVLDRDLCAPHQLESGAYAHVSITDTGTGMDRKTQRRIFEPFFSTKQKNQGTGLGLASAYGIIKNHGGIITVYSEPGHGATFNIYLPLSDKSAVQESAQDGKILMGSEMVLLIDDEKTILKICQEILERLGYQVITAGNSQEALEIINRIGTRIDLVMLDMIMPGMSGKEMFDKIRAIHPNIRVILSSGYTLDGQANEIMQKGCNEFIQKPFNLMEFSQKIRQILDEGKQTEL